MNVSETMAVLAQAPQPNAPGGQGDDVGKSSPVALLVLILFGVAVAFLIKSMSKHLKRVPATFDGQAGATGKRVVDSNYQSPNGVESGEADVVEDDSGVSDPGQAGDQKKP